jgi:ferredoxin
VNAIYTEEDVPEDQRAFTALNAELARIWPMINRTEPALPDADEWAKTTGKLQHLDRG